MAHGTARRPAASVRHDMRSWRLTADHSRASAEHAIFGCRCIDEFLKRRFVGEDRAQLLLNPIVFNDGLRIVTPHAGLRDLRLERVCSAELVKFLIARRQRVELGLDH
jgi:hypothetical protein